MIGSFSGERAPTGTIGHRGGTMRSMVAVVGMVGWSVAPGGSFFRASHAKGIAVNTAAVADNTPINIDQPNSRRKFSGAEQII